MRTDLVAHCQAALKLADLSTSKLTPEILAIHGMSGAKTRHLYNNLCNFPGCRLLEVGCWKGSSTVAALYGNDTATATVVDNWSEFGGPKQEFQANVTKFLRQDQVRHVDRDCWEFFDTEPPAPKGERYQVYVFDGHHEEEDHRWAVTRAVRHLEPSGCVLVVDDWDLDVVRDATLRGIRDAGATVHWSHEVHSRHLSDSDGYWNGTGLFVLSS